MNSNNPKFNKYFIIEASSDSVALHKINIDSFYILGLSCTIYINKNKIKKKMIFR